MTKCRGTMQNFGRFLNFVYVLRRIIGGRGRLETRTVNNLNATACNFQNEDAARESIDGGFGPNIKWYNSLEEGILAAQSDMRPIMVIVHRSWCPACKKLKPELVNSREYFDLSQYFVMVNLDDESDAQDAKRLVPDGGYVPRILFLDWNGELRPEFWNKYGSGKYKYYHSSAQTVTSLMRSALEYFTPISDYYKQQYYQQLQQQQPQYQPYQQYQQYAYQPVEQINSDL